MQGICLEKENTRMLFMHACMHVSRIILVVEIENCLWCLHFHVSTMWTHNLPLGHTIWALNKVLNKSDNHYCFCYRKHDPMTDSMVIPMQLLVDYA